MPILMTPLLWSTTFPGMSGAAYGCFDVERNPAERRLPMCSVPSALSKGGGWVLDVPRRAPYLGDALPERTSSKNTYGGHVLERFVRLIACAALALPLPPRVLLGVL